ncbi:MAG: hypothetical protein AB7U82_09525 [Blastocatellales bacterium]
MATQLFRIKATDSLAFGLIAALLAAVALLAWRIPARRATKIGSMAALYYE